MPKLPYTEPLESLMRSLTCPSLFGFDISYTSNNETTFLTLTRGNVLRMSVSAIKSELKNQGVQFENTDNKIELTDKLIKHFITNKANVNNDFSRPFKAFLEARKTIIEEDSTQRYLQAVQSNPQLMIRKVTINLDDELQDFRPSLGQISQSSQVPNQNPRQSLIGGVTNLSMPPISYGRKRETKMERLIKIACSN